MPHLWIHMFVVGGGVRIVEIPFNASPLDTFVLLVVSGLWIYLLMPHLWIRLLVVVVSGLWRYLLMPHLWIHMFVVGGGVRIVEIPFDASPLDTYVVVGGGVRIVEKPFDVSPLDTYVCCCCWC